MGSSMVGASLMQEMFTGSHERLLVSPLSRSSLLVGRALREIVPTLAQTLADPGDRDAVLLRPAPARRAGGHRACWRSSASASAALSFALALASKDQDWLFWTVQQTVIFPMLLLAGMLLPVDDGPGWLRFASQLNPLTYVIDAERVLFAGDVPGRHGAAGRRRRRGGRRRRPGRGAAGDEALELSHSHGRTPPTLRLSDGGTGSRSLTT